MTLTFQRKHIYIFTFMRIRASVLHTLPVLDTNLDASHVLRPSSPSMVDLLGAAVNEDVFQKEVTHLPPLLT